MSCLFYDGLQVEDSRMMGDIFSDVFARRCKDTKNQ